MTTEKIKRMLDACYQAKRIRELLPSLPQGVTPSYIQYLDNIHALEKQGIQVKISDISDVMNLPRPGVTRTVKEMETKGYLRKISSPDDGRVTYISITEEGRKLSEERAKTVANYFIANGIDPNRIIVVGNGNTKMIGDMNTEEGKIKNRRTDVFFKTIEE